MPYARTSDGIKIYYEEHGSGFPLLLLAPGGLNSTVGFWSRMPIDPVVLFPVLMSRGEFRAAASWQ